MNDENDIRYLNEALILIQRFHTAFGNMFPHAGLLQIGGSRKFKNIVTDIQSNVDRCGLFSRDPNVSALWREAYSLLSRLKSNSKRLSDNDINSIAITLYFTSGLAWNHVVWKSQITPVSDKRYSQIEPLPILCKMTNRKCDESPDLDKILNVLLAELPSLARRS
jgi:hypothetical protein